MTCRAVITPAAEDDLRTAYRYLRERSPEAARTWIRGIRQKIKTLAHNPERTPLAFESAAFRLPIRVLLHGSGNRGTHRILFIVIGKAVLVLHIRHGSMLPLNTEEE